MVVSILLGRFFYNKDVRLTLQQWWAASWFVILAYLIWDIAVTDWWWNFSSELTLPLKLLGLPLNEYLFFLIVSYGCLQLWKCGTFFLKHLKKKLASRKLFVVCSCLFFVVAVVSGTHGLWYSTTVSLLVTISALYAQSDTALRSYLFFYILGLVFMLTTIFNTMLTAPPVVSYSPEIKTNIRLGTIPIEDYLYIVPFFLTTVSLYERQLRKQ